MIKSRANCLAPVLLLSLVACGNKDGGDNNRRPYPNGPVAQRNYPTPQNYPAPPQNYPVPNLNQRGRIGGPVPAAPVGEVDPDDVDPQDDEVSPIPPPVSPPIAPPASAGQVPPRVAVRPAPAAPPRIGPGADGDLPVGGGIGGAVAPASPRRLPVWEAPAVDGSPAMAWLQYNVDPLFAQLASGGAVSQSPTRPVRVTLAIGYMDGFHKKSLNYDGVDYGKNAAVDPFLRAAAEDVVTRPCQGRVQLCGFSLVSANDVSTLYRRVGAGGVAQEIRLVSGAISPRHDDNIGRRAGEQTLRTERARAVFAKSFQDSDFVLYVGHSRKGGGPDFAPPRLKNSDVDYPAYQVKREGAHLLLDALAAQGRRTRALALLSCDSTSHFLNEIRQAGPDLQIVTVRGNIRGENLLAGALGAADLFLRQGQLANLPSVLARQEQVGGNIQLLNPAQP